jgi:hypothetical protein
MFRTSLKIISTVLAAAAIAVPVASAGSPRTPSVGQGFSLGIPLEYQEQTTPSSKPVSDANSVPSQTSAGIVDDWFRDNRVAAVPQPTTPSVGDGFSLGVPLQYLNTEAPTHVTQGFSLGVPLQYLNTGAPTHVTQGFSLGVPVQDLAQPTATARGNGFDWSAAAIGAGIVAGLFLMIAGVGAMTIRSRQSQRAGGLSAT